MFALRFEVIFCVLYSFTFYGSLANKLLGAFLEHQVVPDVTPLTPTNVMTVEFANQTCVHFGNQLTPAQAARKPVSVTWPHDGTWYTLTMVDPDAPSRQNATKREVLHWLVVNVRGNDFAKGKTMKSYIGPKPPKKTALHRYVFLAYKQQSFVDVTNQAVPPRYNFNITRYAIENQLQGPVAGNFFRAQNPEQ